MKPHAKACVFALGLALLAALAGCSGTEQANTPAGGTSAMPPRTPSPSPGTAPTTTSPTAPSSSTGTAPTKADRPVITEKPAEPTPTPKEATHKSGTEKGEVKKEQPPKGA